MHMLTHSSQVPAPSTATIGGTPAITAANDRGGIASSGVTTSVTRPAGYDGKIMQYATRPFQHIKHVLRGCGARA